ncbi:MAG: phosphotransferase family protein [Anaerolineae bacterium]|nr:phosphotransferase family protein [Anaerolineae bacterium]
MRHVEGISIGRKVVSLPELAAARTALPAQMAEQLALIHRLPTAPVGFLAHPSAQGYGFLDSMGAVVPALEYALRWCVRHAPAAGRTTVIHGDFRVGNLLVNPDGLAAVIDWEFAHLGDPHEELGYLCMRDWRFGVDGLRAGGLAHREDFLRSYEHFSGQTVERSAVTWWEIVGNVRWAVICLTQAQRHLSGQDRNVELASLGRRSVEIQAEALRLIQQTEQGAL